MKVLRVRNVSEALPEGLRLLIAEGRREPSRAGEVIVMPFPVTTVYAVPTERVLFSAVRDANPAFHVAEALWMLAGRNDAALLNLFVKDFGERFAEPDGKIHDAYGHRWRVGLGFDQLEAVVEKLRSNPSDRQAVLQMWDASPQWDDLLGRWATRPCNTQAYFRVRDELWDSEATDGRRFMYKVLDMCVCCRSNDIIMGAYGANAVHFSFLQEYIAGHLSVEVGTYTQMSFNYHAYVADIQKLQERAVVPTWIDELGDYRYHLPDYNRGRASVMAMPLAIVSEYQGGRFLVEADNLLRHGVEGRRWDWARSATENDFLRTTALPLFQAHLERSLPIAHTIAASDWRTAEIEWLERRQK